MIFLWKYTDVQYIYMYIYKCTVQVYTLLGKKMAEWLGPESSGELN